MPGGQAARSAKPFSRAASFSLAALFALAFKQSALYTSNQNTYFLQGLADAGVGFLSEDILAGSTDPFGLFTLLVRICFAFPGENAFYFLYWLILALYAIGLTGIADRVLGTASHRRIHLALFSILAGLHCGVLSFLPFSAIDGPLLWGVARQFVLGSVFQPSVFGVLLISAIHAFVSNRPHAAVILAVLAAAFHPTYLLSAALLIGSFMITLRREGRTGRFLLGIGGLALLLTTPIILVVLRDFQLDSPEVVEQARTILVEIRFPHHASPAIWFDGSTVIRMALIAVATMAVWRTRLRDVIGIPALAACVLTLIQVATGSKSLAMLFPWRPSAFLVPVATTVVLARALMLARRSARERPASLKVTANMLVFVLLVAVAGRAVTRPPRLLQAAQSGQTSATVFAREHRDRHDLYLIPPDQDQFRLAAGVPVFVDYKSHPYRADEVVAWHARLRSAQDIYDHGINQKTLAELLENTRITHVLTGADTTSMPAGLREIHRGDQWVVWRTAVEELRDERQPTASWETSRPTLPAGSPSSPD